MADWYFGENEQQIGPLDEVAIRQAIRQGRVGRQTLVWREGMAQWTPLAAVPELLEGPDTLSPYLVPHVTSGGVVVMGPRTSGLAIASLVCGIVSILFCQVIGAVPALICGHMALSQINGSPLPMNGKGMAIAGLILGYIQFVLLAVGLVVLVAIGASS